jgi:hypothetical protein
MSENVGQATDGPSLAVFLNAVDATKKNYSMTK